MSTGSMTIKGASVVEKARDQSGGIKLSHFLRVETSTGSYSQIPFDEYRDAYERSFSRVKPVSSVGIGIGDPDLIQQTIEVPVINGDLNPVLSLLLEKLGLPSGSKITEDKELFIQSELADFLELPWESIAGQTYVLREVVNAPDFEEVEGTKKGFFVLMSHAHQPDKVNIGNEINEEVIDILDQVTRNNKDTFRIDEVYFLKHGTRTAVANTEWNKFKYLHLVLHGEEDGRLCLEKVDHYDQIEHLTKAEFLELLSVDPKPSFLLVFLSFCFSGGGAETSSVAFDLIHTGVAKNAIAYTGGVGSPSAKKFSKLFYNFLTTGDEPCIAFQRSLDKFRSENPDSEYQPMFFMRN